MHNDLLSVTQYGGPYGTAGYRYRSFTYDSLSRLQTAANPETGTICFGQWSGSNCTGGYDPNGNLIYKTDARGLTTHDTYDPLNRLVSKTYPSDTTGTAISCFQYDTSPCPLPTGVTNGYLVNRLTNAWTQHTGTSCTGTTPYFAPVTNSFLTLKSILAYDTMGRPIASGQEQCVGSQCSNLLPWSLSMAYDLAGNMTSLTNSGGAPQGGNQLGTGPLTLTTYFDSASRPCLTTSTSGNSGWSAYPANLFQVNPSTSTPGYAPFAGLQNWYLGSTSSAASTSCSTTPTSPISITEGYTNRLWVNGIAATGQIP